MNAEGYLCVISRQNLPNTVGPFKFFSNPYIILYIQKIFLLIHSQAT